MEFAGQKPKNPAKFRQPSAEGGNGVFPAENKKYSETVSNPIKKAVKISLQNFAVSVKFIKAVFKQPRSCYESFDE